MFRCPIKTPPYYETNQPRNISNENTRTFFRKQILYKNNVKKYNTRQSSKTRERDKKTGAWKNFPPLSDKLVI